MKLSKLLRCAFLPLLALAFSAAAQQDYKYLEKLETPYVPTNQPTVDAMLRIANVGPGDVVIDLGSGDGRILITAAKYHGARGFGVDLDQQLVRESLDNAKAAGVADRVQFHARDLFETKISEATVVTMYLLPHVNLKLRPRLFAELKPGTRIVSHDFGMGDWKADIEAGVRGSGSRIFFWIIPAQVGGRWSLSIVQPRGGRPYEVTLQQKHQEIDGSARNDGKPWHLRDARLEGDRISFTLIDDADYNHVQRFEGRVNGNIIEGTVRGEGSAPRASSQWRATRSLPGLSPTSSLNKTALEKNAKASSKSDRLLR